MFDSVSFTIAAPADGATGVKVSGMTITNGAGSAISIADIDVAAQGGADGTKTQDAATKAMVAAINAKIGETGVLAEVDAAGGGKINLSSVKDSVDKNGAFLGIAVETGTGPASPPARATSPPAPPQWPRASPTRSTCPP